MEAIMPENYTMQRRLAIYSGFAGSGCGEVPSFPIDEALTSAAERQARANIAWLRLRIAYFQRIIEVADADLHHIRRKTKANKVSNGSAP